MVIVLMSVFMLILGCGFVLDVFLLVMQFFLIGRNIIEDEN